MQLWLWTAWKSKIENQRETFAKVAHSTEWVSWCHPERKSHALQLFALLCISDDGVSNSQPSNSYSHIYNSHGILMTFISLGSVPSRTVYPFICSTKWNIQMNFNILSIWLNRKFIGKWYYFKVPRTLVFRRRPPNFSAYLLKVRSLSSCSFLFSFSETYHFHYYVVHIAYFPSAKSPAAAAATVIVVLSLVQTQNKHIAVVNLLVI